MFQEVEPMRFQRTAPQVAAQLVADQGFRPSRQKVLNALASLLDQAEIHRLNAVRNSTTTARVPGWLSEVEEDLLPLVRDPVGGALRLGIRRPGEIASGFMTIDEMVEVAEEAARQSGDPGVQEVIVDKQWDGLCDRNGDFWIA
jgi:hypothetical protein